MCTYFGKRQTQTNKETDRQTDVQHRCVKAEKSKNRYNELTIIIIIIQESPEKTKSIETQLLAMAIISHFDSKLYRTRGQRNLTKSASRGAHSPVRGHPRGSKFVPLNSWGRGSY